MKRGSWAILACVLTLSLVLSACAPAQPPAAGGEKFRVAFVYVGVPGDLGWTYEHDRGRRMLEKELAGKVETAAIEKVPGGPDAARVIRQFAQQGYDMIFTTSFGHMDPTLEVAKEFPKVYFEHCSGYKTADNVATFFGQIEQPRYLSGLVAGRMTQSNIIGYVAAFPIPEVIRGINAFTLGVRKVNPKAEVRVVWTNTWFDPVKEREAAVALLDGGADIIAQHQDTTEPQKAAKERGRLSIGYNSDMAKSVGDTVLTGPVWNWGVHYVQTVRNAIEGRWKTHQYWGGMKEGVVGLAEISPRVPQAVRDMVLAEKDKFVKGELAVFDIFAGPLQDQAGAQRVPAGQKMTAEQILNMDWFVAGVQGTIQK